MTLGKAQGDTGWLPPVATLAGEKAGLGRVGSPLLCPGLTEGGCPLPPIMDKYSSALADEGGIAIY